MELTPSLLNSLLDNILGHEDHKVLRDCEKIIEAIIKLPSELWHVQIKDGYATLWRKKAWLVELEHQSELRVRSEKYNAVLDERRIKFNELHKALCYTLEIPDCDKNNAYVMKMVEKIFKMKSQSAEVLFNINLTNMPELPNKHFVMDPDTGKKLYEL